MGARETWDQLCEKCVPKVTGSEANHARKDNKLCAGLKEGIDGAVHGVQFIWEDNSTNENWGF